MILEAPVDSVSADTEPDDPVIRVMEREAPAGAARWEIAMHECRMEDVMARSLAAMVYWAYVGGQDRAILGTHCDIVVRSAVLDWAHGTAPGWAPAETDRCLQACHLHEYVVAERAA